MSVDPDNATVSRISLLKTGWLAALPRLPQVQQLVVLRERLISERGVSKLWLRGSFARGQADRFSDLDLEIHLTGHAWHPAKVETVLGPDLVALRAKPRPGVATYEGVFNDGLIVDLTLNACESVAHAISTTTTKASHDLLHRYWVSVLKARKLVYRDELLVAQQGLAYQRALLLGALAPRCGLTVEDPATLNIHALRTLTSQLDIPPEIDLAAVLGAPARSWEEMLAAVDSLNQAIAMVEGEASRLSVTVRKLWARRDYLPGTDPDNG